MPHNAIVGERCAPWRSCAATVHGAQWCTPAGDAARRVVDLLMQERSGVSRWTGVARARAAVRSLARSLGHTMSAGHSGNVCARSALCRTAAPAQTCVSSGHLISDRPVADCCVVPSARNRNASCEFFSRVNAPSLF